jgi:fructose-1-phosphate kinase PfkB-like protein
MVVLSGALAPGVASDLYAQCVKQAREANVPTIVDTRDEPLRRAMEEQPTIVKINRSEFDSTFGQAPRSSTWIVITDGPRDVEIFSASGSWRITPPKIDVVSAVGSGDAFAAGLAAALVDGEEMPQACLLATACAAANAMRPVAGFLDPSEVHALRGQIALSQVD